MNELHGMWVQQGWQCPICKKVLAPNQSYCIFCASTEPKITFATGTSIDVDWLKYQSKTVSDNLENK